jgi:predicted nicotinamide N-methyase
MASEISISSKTTMINIGQNLLSVKHLTKTNSTDEIWQRAWGCSFVLAAYLDLILPSFSSNGTKNSIEIGSGSSPLPSMIACIYKHNTTVTDASQEAIDFSRILFIENKLERLNFELYNWNSDLPNKWKNVFDFMFGSDILYLQRNILPIIKTINETLTATGIAILCDPGRFVADEFVDQLINDGLYNFRYTMENFRTDFCILKKCVLIIVSKSEYILKDIESLLESSAGILEKGSCIINNGNEIVNYSYCI